MEKIEELLGSVESWATETECLLSETGHKTPVEPQMEEYLQVKMEIHSYIQLKILVQQIFILQRGFMTWVKCTQSMKKKMQVLCCNTRW